MLARLPLDNQDQLAAAASGHSQDMAQNDLFDHTGSDGSTLLTRVEVTCFRPLHHSQLLTYSQLLTWITTFRRLASWASRSARISPQATTPCAASWPPGCAPTATAPTSSAADMISSAWAWPLMPRGFPTTPRTLRARGPTTTVSARRPARPLKPPLLRLLRLRHP